MKTRHMAEAVLEVECARPADAMVVLERLPEIKEVALFGAGLHVIAKDESAARTAVERALVHAGLRPRSIERITPTLEDVFVSLIEARDRADGALKEVRG
jgi:ABC-2 type transport system ATP-binding protein